jgi:hypothetical protein
MTYDFKTQTPDTSFVAATAFLFGADSQSSANPAIYQGSTVVAGMIGGSSGQIQYNSSSAFGGAAALVYATSGTHLTITATGAAIVPLNIVGASGQSANLLNLTADGGTAGALLKVSSAGVLTLQNNAILTAPAAASLQFGAADAASPVAQSLSAQSVATGTANTAGAALTIKGSRGTGTGTAGAINIQIAAAGGAGSTQNSLATILGLAQTGASITSPLAASIGLTITGASAQTGNLLNVTANGGGAGALFNIAADGTATLQNAAILTAPAAASLQLGAADAASPVAQTLAVQSVATGTSDTAGADFTITGSQGTGSGTAGSILLQIAPAGGSGSTPNSLATALSVAEGGVGVVSPLAASVGFTVTGASAQTGNLIDVTANGGAAGALFNVAADGTLTLQNAAILTGASAANLQLGAADAAAPVAQTLGVQNVVAGTADTAGTDFTIAGSIGTGTGTGGAINLQIAPAGGAGSAQNSLATVLSIVETGVSLTNPLATAIGLTITGAAAQSANLLDITANGGGAGALFNVASDGTITLQDAAILTGPAAANLQLGAADAAAPVAQKLSVQSVATGTADTAGTAFTIAGSKGTGTGTAGAINLQIAPSGGAGSTPNSLATILSLAETGASITSPAAAAIGLTVTGASAQTGNLLDLTANGGGAGALFNIAADGALTLQDAAILTAPTAAQLQLGAADAAAPVAQTLGVQNVVTGTTDTAGATFIIAGSQGTGTGTAGAINLQIAPSSGTGNTPNALATILSLAETGVAISNPAAAAVGLSVEGAAAQSANLFDITSNGGSAGDLFNLASDGTLTLQSYAILTAPSAANLQLGAADAAAPVAQTLKVQNVVTGTSDTAGATFIIAGSQGTGTGTAGAINLQIAPSSGTGSTPNSLATILSLAETGVAITNPAAAAIGLSIEGAAAQSAHLLDVTSNGGSAGDLFNLASDGTATLQSNAILTAPGAAKLQLGAADAASAVAQTLTAQSVVAGTTDTAGANLTIAGSVGTGTGAGGQIILRTAPASSTGDTQNALATGLTVTAPAVSQQPSVVVGNQAIATDATDGFIYIPGGAGTPTGVPTGFAGRYALYWDTTNKMLYVYDGGWLGGTNPGAFTS